MGTSPRRPECIWNGCAGAIRAGRSRWIAANGGREAWGKFVVSPYRSYCRGSREIREVRNRAQRQSGKHQQQSRQREPGVHRRVPDVRLARQRALLERVDVPICGPELSGSVGRVIMAAVPPDGVDQPSHGGLLLDLLFEIDADYVNPDL